MLVNQVHQTEVARQHRVSTFFENPGSELRGLPHGAVQVMVVPLLTNNHSCHLSGSISLRLRIHAPICQKVLLGRNQRVQTWDAKSTMSHLSAIHTHPRSRCEIVSSANGVVADAPRPPGSTGLVTTRLMIPGADPMPVQTKDCRSLSIRATWTTQCRLGQGRAPPLGKLGKLSMTAAASTRGWRSSFLSAS
jgi:hypothetical protein